MSGVIGCINFDFNKNIDKNLGNRMMSRIRHRGPDFEKIINIDNKEFIVTENSENSFGTIGYNFLKIEENDNPNFSISEDKKIICQFDGQIYNIDQVKKMKDIDAEKQDSKSDVLLKAYKTIGFDKLVKELDGMFSLVILDLEKMKLYIARDRFGLVPINYIINENFIAWASEMKSFIEIKNFKRELNMQSVYNLFTYAYEDCNLLKNVNNLNAGIYLDINLSEKTYKEVEFFNIGDIKPYDESEISEEEIERKFRELLQRSVKMVLGNSKKVGAEMSGGIDSTMIAKYVSEAVKPDGKAIAYSMVNKNYPKYNEEKWADVAANIIPIETRKIDLNKDMLLENLEKTIYAFEKIIFYPSAIGIYGIAQKANEDNIKLVFNGEEAEAITGSTMTLLCLKHEKLHKKYKNIAENKSIAKYIPGTYEFFKDFGREVQIDECKKLFKDYNIEPLIERRKKAFNSFKGSTFRKLAEFHMFTMSGETERQNKILATHQIEPRYPILQNDVAEFLQKLPETYSLKYGETKHIMKVESENIFGREFAQKPKYAVRVPFELYFANEEFKKYVEENILDNIEKRNILNIEQAKEYLKFKNEDDVAMVWRIVNLELWCQMFLDGKIPE